MNKRILLLADVNSVHTMRWAGGVASLGYEVAIFSLSSATHQWFVTDNIRYFHADEVSVRSKAGYLFHLRRLKEVIKEFQPAIIHAYYSSSYGLLGALTGFHPFIITAYGSDVLSFPKRSPVHKAILKFNLSRADLILATGKYLEESVKRYTKTEVRIVPFGVDTSFFSPNKIRRKTRITIGVIKSLEYIYGIDLLIRAFRSVQERFPDKNLRLFIGGDGSLRYQLGELVSECGLSKKVKFAGKIPVGDIPLAHNKIDIFVNPSRMESFGVSVLEASACGVPVVVSRTGGLTEVVKENITGLTVEPGNIEQLAEAISFFVTDEEERQRFGKNGRDFVVDNFDWNKSLLLIDDIYRTIRTDK